MPDTPLTFNIDGKPYKATYKGAGTPTQQELDEIEQLVRQKYGLNKATPSPVAGIGAGAFQGIPPIPAFGIDREAARQRLFSRLETRAPTQRVGGPRVIPLPLQSAIVQKPLTIPNVASEINETTARLAENIWPLNIPAMLPGSIHNLPGVGQFIPKPADMAAAIPMAPLNAAANTMPLLAPETPLWDRAKLAASIYGDIGAPGAGKLVQKVGSKLLKPKVNLPDMGPVRAQARAQAPNFYEAGGARIPAKQPPAGFAPKPGPQEIPHAPSQMRPAMKEIGLGEPEQQALEMLELRNKELAGGKGPSVKAVKSPASGTMRQERAEAFYSKLQRVIEDKVPNRASADQIRKTLEGAGVKPEEIQYTDLERFLSEATGPISKQDLLEHVAENRVQLKEVERGAASDEVAAWWNDEGGANETVPWENLNESQRRVAHRRYLEEVGQYDHEGTAPKFGQYTSPGGSDYRELLLTLPSREGYDQLSANGKLAARMSGEPVFKSPHWDEPNVLAHIRFDTRTGPKGEKILHIAEIQSDWHQAGRKKGYAASPDEIAALEKRRGPLLIQLDDLRARSSSPEYAAARQELDALDAKISQMRASVPDAPFKKNWHELAMKRMIRYAAENDFDRITWDTGATSAERYDLSKQVDYISYSKDGEGTWSISARKGNEELVGKRGQTPAQLEDLVGKDITQKIVDGVGHEAGAPPGSGELRGLDLKVGGEGMKGFYDKILPDFVNKYTKKWGGAAGRGAVPGRNRPLAYILKSPVEGFDVRTAEGETIMRSAPLEVAERKVRQWNAASGDTHDAHSLDLTPEMKASVLNEGQPLFQKGEKLEGLKPAGDNIRLVHYSGQKGLKELDPEMLGKGLAPNARDIQVAKGGGVKGTWLYPEGSKIEHQVGSRAKASYYVDVPKDSLYDILADEQGLYKNAPGLGDAKFEAAKRAIKDAGYKGLLGGGTADNPLHNRVYLFDKTPVKEFPHSGKYTLGDKAAGPDPAVRLAELGQENGGFSFDPKSGELNPKTGYMVGDEAASSLKERVLQFEGELTPEHVRQWLAQNPDLPEGAHMGAWKDGDKWTLEVSHKFDDLEEAMQAARERGEKAIWDNAAQKEIRVKASQSPHIDTPEFKEWFGKSKVVSEDGSPQVVYHGSRKGGFTKFKTHMEGILGRGAYFTDAVDEAADYAGPTPSIYPSYLKMERPYRTYGGEWSTIWEDVIGTDLRAAGEMPTPAQGRKLLQALKDQGYDGIIEEIEGLFENKRVKNYVVFDPEQIKSRFNRGTFDPKDPNILHQTEGILAGAEKTPKFKGQKALQEAGKFLEDYAKQNPVFTKPLKELSDAEIINGIAEHTMRELDAWEKVRPEYRSFYGDDIQGFANPALDRWARSELGRPIKPEEVRLFHVIGSLASAGETPAFDSHAAFVILSRYLKDGELTPYHPTATKMTESGVTKSTRITQKFQAPGLERVKHLINEKGLKGAMDWLGEQHSFDEISQMFGREPKTIKTHEYLGKADGGLGMFGALGAKQGSYALNRWGEYGTITKDMWVARTMGRYSGQMFDKTGALVSDPWNLTQEGVRLRKALDSAWNKVAKERGMTPAGVQEAMWDAEKILYGKLGVRTPTTTVSEGVTRGMLRERGMASQRGAPGIKGTYDPKTRAIELVQGKADFSTGVHELGHDLHLILQDHPEWGELVTKHYGRIGPEASSEAFARHLEQYFRTGKAPIAALKDVFEAIGRWMKEIYTTWTHGKAKPEIKKMFDKIYGEVSPEMQKLIDEFEGGKSSASKVKEAATVHADVPTQPVVGKGQVPVEGGGEGVQPKPAPAAKTEEVRPGPKVPPGSTGISHEATAVRAAEGKTGVVERGVGSTPERMVARGRQIAGEAEERLKAYEQSGKVDGDDIAAFRARAEELAKVTNKAEDFSSSNPESVEARESYEAAYQAETAWRRRIKPAQTEFQRQGVAMQGVTDIDTGTFSGLRRGFEDLHGRDMNPGEQKTAQAHAKYAKDLEDEISKLRSELEEALKTQAEKPRRESKSIPSDKMGLKSHLEARIKSGSIYQAPRPGGKQSGAASAGKRPHFTAEERNAIWKYAKDQYVDKGGMVFDEVVEEVAKDLGIDANWVRQAMAEPKQVRTVTADMYRKMHERRQQLMEARAWLESANTPMIFKIANEVYELPRSAMSAVDQSTGFRQLWFFNMGDMLWAPKSMAKHAVGEPVASFWSKPWAEREIQRIEKHSLYDQARQDGLAIDIDAPQKASQEFYGSRVLTGVQNPEKGNPLFAPIKKLWNQVNPYVRSQTAFDVPGMSLRLSKYEDGLRFFKELGMADENGQIPAEMRKAFAKALNVVTAGEPLQAGELSKLFTKAMFSGKLLKTQIATINPVFYAKLPAGVRRYMIAQAAKNFSVVAFIAGVAKTAQYMGVDADVEIRPWETDFGKARYKNQRVGLLGGRESVIRTLWRLTADSLQGKWYDANQELGKFASYRAHPSITGARELASGKDIVTGKPKPREETALGLVSPMITGDIKDAYENGDEGEKLAIAIMVAVLSNFGFSAQAYEKKETKASPKAPAGPGPKVPPASANIGKDIQKMIDKGLTGVK